VKFTEERKPTEEGIKDNVESIIQNILMDRKTENVIT
jgi:hypothetical protein